jgi:hypothetical protein
MVNVYTQIGQYGKELIPLKICYEPFFFSVIPFDYTCSLVVRIGGIALVILYRGFKQHNFPMNYYKCNDDCPGLNFKLLTICGKTILNNLEQSRTKESEDVKSFPPGFAHR